MQHGIGNAGNWTAMAAVTRKHVELVAKLAGTLAGDSGKSVLAARCSTTRSSCSCRTTASSITPSQREWPKLVIGGNAIGMKTDGRTVVYPAQGRARNRQVSNLFNTLGHALGDSTFDTFGAEGKTRIAEGPLSEPYA